MNGNFLLFAGAAILCMVTGSSLAETVNTTAELQGHPKTAAYLVSAPMLEQMYRSGVAQDKKFGLQSGCISQSRVKPIESLVLSPIEFPDGQQNPTRGAWFSRYEFERCSESKIYNVLFMANGSGAAPMARTYYPGATIASPNLINDAMPSVVSGALARSGLKKCKDADVFDMRVIVPAHDVTEGDKIFRNVWSEGWTLRMCGKLNDVEVTFTPDANGGGTTFTSGPVKLGGVHQPVNNRR